MDMILENAKNDINIFREHNPNGVVVIRGATATGKSALSVKIADHFPIEVISADSRQIFKYMNIGTDKISEEIRKKIPHYQIDIVNPDQTYTAGQRKSDSENHIINIQKNNNIPFIVGGTGLYINMLYKNWSMPDVEADQKLREELEQKEVDQIGFLHNYLKEIDPETANTIHPQSIRHIIRAIEIFEKTGKKRSEIAKELPVKYPLLMIGLRREKEDSNKKIVNRIDEMIKTGLIQEVESLVQMGYNSTHQAMNGIGYKEVIGYLNGQYDLNNTIESIKQNSCHYAKRQRTWFRKYIKESIENPKENVIYKLYNL